MRCGNVTSCTASKYVSSQRERFSQGFAIIMKPRKWRYSGFNNSEAFLLNSFRHSNMISETFPKPLSAILRLQTLLANLY